MTQTYRPLAAIVWMTGAIAAFTSMAIAGRAVKDVHDTFEIMTARSVIGFVLVVVVAAALGRLDRIRTDRMGQHLIRNLLHFTGQNLWFYAITVIPLAQVFALEFTSPIWVILLSPLVLGERLTPMGLIAALLGFVGILIVARPDFASLEPGVVAAAGSAVFFAATMLMTKALTRGEDIISILFWLTVMQAVFGAVMAGYDGRVSWPTAQTLPWLALIGLAGVVAHLCLTTALSLAPASFVAPIDFARLPIIAVVGALLYGEPVSLAVIAGGALIFFGNWLTIRAQNHARKSQNKLTEM